VIDSLVSANGGDPRVAIETTPNMASIADLNLADFTVTQGFVASNPTSVAILGSALVLRRTGYNSGVTATSFTPTTTVISGVAGEVLPAFDLAVPFP